MQKLPPPFLPPLERVISPILTFHTIYYIHLACIHLISGSSHCGSVTMNPTNIHEDAGWIPSPSQGAGVAVNCGVGHRRASDPALLWLWHRPAAVATFQPLTWEFPYAAGAALKKTKKQNKKPEAGKMRASSEGRKEACFVA